MNSASALLSALTRSAATYAMMPSSSKNPAIWAPFHQELILARTARANLLVVGPERLVSDVLNVVIPVGKHQAVVRGEHERLLLPSSSRDGIAVIPNAETLSVQEQRILLDWLQSPACRTQVITTAATPLIPLIESGLFDEALYYRLNTLYINLSE